MTRSAARQNTVHRVVTGLVAALSLFIAVAVAPVAEAAQTASPATHKVAKASTQKAKPTRKKAVKRKRRSAAAAAVDDLTLRSNSVLVVDHDNGELVAFKNPDTVTPIASLTKLMTGLVVLDSGLPLDEMLEIGPEDVDTERHTHSRLAVGTQLRRDEMLLLALMSSENRAAKALGRHYPGGRSAFIAKMNEKAKMLGMVNTQFADTAGLSNGSRSTARDLQYLIKAAHELPLMRQYSTQPEGKVKVRGRELTFVNSNRLVRSSSDDWDIDLQKTGFTNEAGRCLVMHATVLGRRLMMVFLDSNGAMTRYADAARIRRQIERDARKAKPVSTQGKPVADAAS